MESRTYFSIVRRRWWLLFGIPIALGAIVFLSSRSGQDVYRASTTLLITNRALILEGGAVAGGDDADSETPQGRAAGGIPTLNELVPDEQIIETFSQLITRRVVLQEVLSTLSLPYSESVLREKISAGRIQGTQLVRVSATDQDPALAAAIANQAVATFIDINRGETGPGGLVIVDQAEEPRTPLRSSILRPMVLVVAASFFMGLMLALMLEFLDDKIRTPEDVIAFSGYPTLAVIHRHRASRGHPRGTAAAEDYRMLRTNLRMLCDEHDVHTLLVASPGRREGRSRTVLNLGYMLAEAGESVVLVDADLRQPSLHTLTGTANNQGLSDILAGSVGAGSVRLEVVDERLRLMTAGSKVENPSIVSFPQMRDVLTELRARADYVILDTPALGAVVDASDVARSVDGIILLVEAGHTSTEALESALTILEQSHAKLIGVVLNKAPAARTPYISYKPRQVAYPASS